MIKKFIIFIKSINKKTKWIHESYRSHRWISSFAFLPVKTFDAGWIWGRTYWRHQISSGWGFFDDFPYTQIQPE